MHKPLEVTPLAEELLGYDKALQFAEKRAKESTQVPEEEKETPLPAITAFSSPSREEYWPGLFPPDPEENEYEFVDDGSD